MNNNFFDSSEQVFYVIKSYYGTKRTIIVLVVHSLKRLLLSLKHRWKCLKQRVF